MKRWRVETRVTSRCIYFVDAEDEKEAEAASVNESPEYSEDENEETISIMEDSAPVTRPDRTLTGD